MCGMTLGGTALLLQQVKAGIKQDDSDFVSYAGIHCFLLYSQNINLTSTLISFKNKLMSHVISLVLIKTVKISFRLIIVTHPDNFTEANSVIAQCRICLYSLLSLLAVWHGEPLDGFVRKTFKLTNLYTFESV